MQVTFTGSNPSGATTAPQSPSATPRPTHTPQYNDFISPERWFRLFDFAEHTTIRIDVAPVIDSDVTRLASRLRSVAGQSRGQIALDLTAVEQYTTAWMTALSDLASVCTSLGGKLLIEGMCPRAQRVFDETRRLHYKPLRKRDPNERFARAA
jgi:anti-anti-sigma regulatory factor